jgi:hypothetical protein
MLTLISARRGLGGTFRQYQHDRLGIITTVTHAAIPTALIIRIYRARQDSQEIASNAPEFRHAWPDGQMEGGSCVNHGRGLRANDATLSMVHPALLEPRSTKNPVADQGTAVKATKNFRSDVAHCPQCKARPEGVAGGLCLDCLLAQIARNCKDREAPTKRLDRAKTKAPPMSKRCRSCGVSQPLDRFGKHRLSRDGHRHDCKARVNAERAISAPRC